jgi:fructokinase
MRVPREPFTERFQGTCTFLNDCLEGIASGHAMQQRYAKKAEEISETEP